MTNNTNTFIQLAKQYVEELPFQVSYASVGGSVSRGEADEYSDIDLTVYTSDFSGAGEKNVEYKGEIIQLDMNHINEFPNRNSVISQPWDHRFLYEALIIKDTDGHYNSIQNYFGNYLSTKAGKQVMFNQVSKIVAERKSYALYSVDHNRMFSATNAALGAWAEAAFLYLFFKDHSLATGKLIGCIQALESHFDKFQALCPFSLNVAWEDFPGILIGFRRYLRKQQFSFEFGLSPVQDTLYERKVQRLLKSEEYLNLLWQTYGEALWLFFEAVPEGSFEAFFNSLPGYLQKNLAKIGFVELTSNEIKELCDLSDELIGKCKP